MYAALVCIVGLVVLILGIGLLLSCVLPRWGGGQSEEATFPLGLIFTGGGIGLIFYAGSLL